MQFLIKKKIVFFQLYGIFFNFLSSIGTLDPDTYPDSLEMLNPDPHPGGGGERRSTTLLVGLVYNLHHTFLNSKVYVVDMFCVRENECVER